MAYQVRVLDPDTGEVLEDGMYSREEMTEMLTDINQEAETLETISIPGVSHVMIRHPVSNNLLEIREVNIDDHH